MLTKLKNKHDLTRALSKPNVRLCEEREVVNESDVRAVTGTLQALLSKGKKLHVIIVERP